MGDCLKGGRLGQFVNLKRVGLARKRRGVFLRRGEGGGVNRPMQTMQKKILELLQLMLFGCFYLHPVVVCFY